MAYDPQRFQWAIHVVKSGLSANEGFRQMTAQIGGMHRSDWLSLVRAARQAVESNATAVARPGARKPYSSEIYALSTVTATGYLQHVDIWVRDRETGEIYSRPYTIAGDDLLTHDDAVATAIEQYSGHADGYDQDVLGATYSATYVGVPKGR